MWAVNMHTGQTDYVPSSGCALQSHSRSVNDYCVISLVSGPRKDSGPLPVQTGDSRWTYRQITTIQTDKCRPFSDAFNFELLLEGSRRKVTIPLCR